MHRAFTIIIVCAISFTLLLSRPLSNIQRHDDSGFPPPPVWFPTVPSNPKNLGFFKPQDVRIIGLVFFGRRSRVELLRCFLERSLVVRGGWLDEVHWVKNTDNPKDLKYLNEIVASSPSYKTVELGGIGFVGYGEAWSKLEPGALYVKIDDDVVWFEDDTIPRIVSMKLEHPEYLLVSANMINSPLMGWVHYHMGAMHPYMPEFDGHAPGIFGSKRSRRVPWSYLSHPEWTGPENYTFDAFQDPPYDGHRWLRLPGAHDIHRTPIAEIEYATWGTGLKSWAIAAQQHYSFLENLWDGNLDRYMMREKHQGNLNEKPWLTTGGRLSINFVTIWADDVLENLPMDTVDEEWLTVNLPKKLHREVTVNTQALAVHFSFGTQGKLEQTDLLARYRDFALENVCAS